MGTQKPHGPADMICPLHRSRMSKVCHTCPWWGPVRGRNPNTGEEVDHWNCAIALLPMLTINVANEARQGAAATESFRNEVVASMARPQQLVSVPGASDVKRLSNGR
jgi:hypothetical protein